MENKNKTNNSKHKAWKPLYNYLKIGIGRKGVKMGKCGPQSYELEGPHVGEQGIAILLVLHSPSSPKEYIDHFANSSPKAQNGGWNHG